jgi:hypothetical protein
MFGFVSSCVFSLCSERDTYLAAAAAYVKETRLPTPPPHPPTHPTFFFVCVSLIINQKHFFCLINNLRPFLFFSQRMMSRCEFQKSSSIFIEIEY